MRRGVAAVALLSAFGVSACSLVPGSRQTESPGAPPATSQPAPPPSAGSQAPGSAATPAGNPAGSPAATGATGAPTGGAPTDQLGPVVATRTTSLDGENFRVELHPLVRDGNLTHLQLSVSSDSETGVAVFNMFSDSNASTGDKSDWTADGIRLVDTAHNKLYLVASDGHGTCLCSRNLVAVQLKNNLPVVVSASFATPPADMPDIQVQIPNFGVFPHVPIS